MATETITRKERKTKSEMEKVGGGGIFFYIFFTSGFLFLSFSTSNLPLSKTNYRRHAADGILFLFFIIIMNFRQRIVEKKIKTLIIKQAKRHFKIGLNEIIGLRPRLEFK